MSKHFATLDGLKRAARKLKRTSGLGYSAALEQVAREAGFNNYHHAKIHFTAASKQRDRAQFPVTIHQSWFDRERGERGKETRTFMLDRPLGELVKPHQLTGYLGGCSITDPSTIVCYGRSHDRSQARLEICRVTRTLQFISATGLKPSRGSRCYPKGDWHNRSPGADHDQTWYDPKTRSFVLSEEPYPDRCALKRGKRLEWTKLHNRKTAKINWGSIYGFGTELYLTVKDDGRINVAALARRLNAAAPAYKEDDWPETSLINTTSPQNPVAQNNYVKNSLKTMHDGVEAIKLPPEFSALLIRQEELDIAEAGSKAPKYSIVHRGVKIESRYGVASELATMSKMVDHWPDLIRVRVATVWCDSKACAVYSVEIKRGRWIDGIEDEIVAGVRDATDGFNGLIVRDDTREKFFGAEWSDDAIEYGNEYGLDLNSGSYDDEPL